MIRKPRLEKELNSFIPAHIISLIFIWVAYKLNLSIKVKQKRAWLYRPENKFCLKLIV